MTGELNLAPDRGPSVWTRQSRARNEERERRWTSAASGVGLMAIGSLLSVIGWRLLQKGTSRSADPTATARRKALPTFRPRLVAPRGAARDIVSEESAQGFPASDAPSWTPTTGAI